MCRVIIVFVALFAFTYGFPKVSLPVQKLDERIIGGEEANIEDFPYQLSVQSDGRHRCGASIISADWALSAARCIESYNASSVILRAGSSLRNEGGSVHNASRIILHPQFKYKEYDYALIQVSTPFPLGNPGIQAVPLAEEEPAGGDSAVISGWGSQSSANMVFPIHLRSVNLPIMSREFCQYLYTGLYNITDRMICAGKKEGGIGHCYADFGGPLVVSGIQVGIVSFGLGCEGYNNPGIYSNVADQREWIRENTGV